MSAYISWVISFMWKYRKHIVEHQSLYSAPSFYPCSALSILPPVCSPQSASVFEQSDNANSGIACVASVPERCERNSGRAKEVFAFGPRGKWGESKKVEGPPLSFHIFARASFLVQSALLGWFGGLPAAKALRCWGVNFNVCLIN